MVSSIYKLPINIAFKGEVNSFTITSAGTGYSGAITVAIGSPDATTETATTEITEGSVTSINIANTGAGYSEVPSVIITAPTSGTTAQAVATISNGFVISLKITNPGSGYNTPPTVTIADPTKVPATGTAVLNGTGVDTPEIVEKGIGYLTVPSISITGAGGGTDAVGVLTIGSLPANTPILSSNIPIITEQVTPGGGGLIRVYFSVEFSTSSIGDFQVLNNGDFKGNLNPDNSSQVVSKGYYRFDIDAEAGDNINFQSKQDLSVTFLRAHLVLLGA